MNKIKQVLDARGIHQTWPAEKLGKSVNMINSYALNKMQPSLVIAVLFTWKWMTQSIL